MSVTFFDNGITVTDANALRADTFAVEDWLSRYINDHDGDTPPGWPSQAAHKTLIEFSIRTVYIDALKAYEIRKRQEAILEPDPWEGPGG